MERAALLINELQSINKDLQSIAKRKREKGILQRLLNLLFPRKERSLLEIITRIHDLEQQLSDYIKDANTLIEEKNTLQSRLNQATEKQSNHNHSQPFQDDSTEILLKGYQLLDKLTKNDSKIHQVLDKYLDMCDMEFVSYSDTKQDCFNIEYAPVSEIDVPRRAICNNETDNVVVKGKVFLPKD